MEKKEKSKSDYKSFIQDKHKRLFNTSDKVITKIVKKVTGSKVLNKEKIIKGEANEVYSINLETGSAIILRISHANDPQFEKEKWVIDQCAVRGIPVPEVLGVESIKFDNQKLTVSIESKLPGTPLNEIDSLLLVENKMVLDGILRQAGKILSEINQIEAYGFGELDKDGKAKKKSIQEVLLDEYIQEEIMIKISQEVSLDIGVIKRAFEILKQGALNYPVISPKLIHNDFGPKHLLVESGQITGIIDFENAEGGDPVREFARWDFYFRGRYPLEALKDGYTDKNIFSKDFDLRMNIWKVFIGLTSLRYYYEENNPVGLELSKKRLLENFS